jgi:hypothetical protein
LIISGIWLLMALPYLNAWLCYHLIVPTVLVRAVNFGRLFRSLQSAPIEYGILNTAADRKWGKAAGGKKKKNTNKTVVDNDESLQ